MDDENMPTTELTADEIGEGITLDDLMIRCNLAKSRGEVRRLAEQGGLSVNNEKETDFKRIFTAEELRDGVTIKKGKKVFHKAIIK